MQTLTDFLCRKIGCHQWIRVVFRHTDWNGTYDFAPCEQGVQEERIKFPNKTPLGDMYSKICKTCGAEYTFYPELKLHFSMKEGGEDTLLADGKD